MEFNFFEVQKPCVVKFDSMEREIEPGDILLYYGEHYKNNCFVLRDIKRGLILVSIFNSPIPPATNDINFTNQPYCKEIKAEQLLTSNTPYKRALGKITTPTTLLNLSFARVEDRELIENWVNELVH